MEAARNILPVAATAAESVERLRAWASGRRLAAHEPGIYSRPGAAAERPGRYVRRDPSNN